MPVRIDTWSRASGMLATLIDKKVMEEEQPREQRYRTSGGAEVAMLLRELDSHNSAGLLRVHLFSLGAIYESMSGLDELER